MHPATDAPDGNAVGRQSGHQARGGASRQLAIDREFLILANRRLADLLGHIAAMARALLRGEFLVESSNATNQATLGEVLATGAVNVGLRRSLKNC